MVATCAIVCPFLANGKQLQRHQLLTLPCCRKIETNLSRRVKTFKSRPCHPNYPKVDNYQEVAAISPIILELSTDIQHDMAQWNAVVQGIKSNTNSVMAIIILRSKHVEVA